MNKLVLVSLLFVAGCGGDVLSSSSNTDQRQNQEQRQSGTCASTCGLGNEELDVCDCSQEVEETETLGTFRIVTDCRGAGGVIGIFNVASLDSTCDECNQERSFCFDGCRGCES